MAPPDATPAIAIPTMTVAKTESGCAPAPISAAIDAATVAITAVALLSSVPNAKRKELASAVRRPATRVVTSIAANPSGRWDAREPE
jgi:hypothetical protein